MSRGERLLKRSAIIEKQKKSTLQFAKFLIVGGVNTIVGLSIIFLSKWMLGVGDVIANMLGYSCGLVVSFFGNASFTFNLNGDKRRAAIAFLVVFILAYSANLTVVLFVVHILNENSYIAQVCGVFVYTPLFYLGSKYHVFRD